MKVSAERAQSSNLSQFVSRSSHAGDAAALSWFTGFTRTKTGNFIAEFFLAKKSSDVVLAARINLYKSDRTTKPGCNWTWGIQITDGPRRMIMEKPAFSNLFFAGPHEAAISVRDDLHGGGYFLTQPPRTSITATIAREQAIVERVAEAEDRAYKVKPARTRIIDT